MTKKIKKVFFGTPQISVDFLEKLKNEDFLFDVIITNPDKPVGRKKILTPSPVKKWAEENKIEVLSPEKLDGEFLEEVKSCAAKGGAAQKKEKYLFFVLAYGKILKKNILDFPELGVWNLHPSLLPKYRGPSPIMSAILDDQKETGISLMLLDEKMDHGPILAQKKIFVEEWKKNREMEKWFAEEGADLFLEILDDFAEGKIIPQEQNHDQATYCEKYHKSDMELKKPLESRENFLKFLAFPKPFFFDENGRRNVVSDGRWNEKEKKFEILKIIPEGKKEQEYKK